MCFMQYGSGGSPVSMELLQQAVKLRHSVDSDGTENDFPESGRSQHDIDVTV